MNQVTNYYIWLKSYLNFVKWVADIMRGSNTLALAIANFKLILRKKYKNYKINFSTLTEMISLVLSSFSKIHFTLSPWDRSNSSTISFGIVHLKELDWRFA